MASELIEKTMDTIELLQAADKWVDENYKQPTAADRLLARNAFLTAAHLTVKQMRREFQSITK
jgi:hypothetical protein